MPGSSLGRTTCSADVFRRVRGKPETRAGSLVAGRATMLALPPESSKGANVQSANAHLGRHGEDSEHLLPGEAFGDLRP